MINRTIHKLVCRFPTITGSLFICVLVVISLATDRVAKVYAQSTNDPAVSNNVYVNFLNAGGAEDGSAARPFNTVAEGANAVSSDGTVWIAAGNYQETLTINKRMTLRSTKDAVIIGRRAAGIELIGLEVTQAIQDWNNSVPLIQGKAAFVRAHVRNTSGKINNVKALLYGSRDGNALPSSPLSPANVGGTINVIANPNRASINDSFLFELLASWRSGTVSLGFQIVRHEFACRESTGVANDCVATVTFEPMPELPVVLVNVRWTQDRVSHEPSAADSQQVRENIRAQFPVLTFAWAPSFSLREPRLTYNRQPNLDTVLEDLEALRILCGLICGAARISDERIHFGLIDDHPGGNLGLGYTPGFAATGYYRSSDLTTAAHEISHNLGIRHTACDGSEKNTDSSYPYSDGHISNVDSGDDAFYGFNIVTRDIIASDSGDLLGYCRPRWISDFNYRRVMAAIRAQQAASVAARAPEQTLETTGVVMVSGFITSSTGVGRISRLLEVDVETTVSLPESGSYSLTIENTSGQTLFSYPFDPQKLSEGDQAIFAVVLPQMSSAARIVLRQGERVLDIRSASNNPPLVTVTSPNGGEVFSGDAIPMIWSATDADGDSLTYVVQYSTDNGKSWQVAALNQTETNFTLNLAGVAGSNQARIRVLASDGFHSVEDESDGPFIVRTLPPQVSIESPENNRLFVEGQPILLVGTAYDNEDGDLGDGAFTWHSSINGQLGVGASIDLIASDLMTGTHIITLTAMDSNGQNGSASITIQVSHVRPTLPASLADLPQLLVFEAEQGGMRVYTTTLPIRNSGDGDLAWSASVDQNWIQVSPASGGAPEDVTITINPTALAVSEYTGNIAITAAGAEDSPQTVQIQLVVTGKPNNGIYLPLIMR